ncbi:unnamed protein product, partial [Auanema sp. JU1783]
MVTVLVHKVDQTASEIVQHGTMERRR